MEAVKNINGVTKKDVTRIMRGLERKISFYNKKYKFDVSFPSGASEKEIKEYETALKNWDFMKTKRDQL